MYYSSKSHVFINYMVLLSFDLPMTPNFFLAAKGPDRSLTVARRQACYDDALRARGMHSLQSYGKAKLVYDNNAYTITSTYHGGTLKMYTSHVIPLRSLGGGGFLSTI
jgi:hypothetical protein